MNTRKKVHACKERNLEYEFYTFNEQTNLIGKHQDWKKVGIYTFAIIDEKVMIPYE
tara:strand:+ start:263 stop:430 length:168 start_codon:yes stop_codon:yes gene_type:complete